MTQFDPSMVAQMLMQPVGRESLDNSISDENFFQPIEIPSESMVAPLDMQGGFFIDPETAGKVAYGGAVTGASFIPGAGIVDAYGGAVDVTGQPLPSFSENIGQGNYLDAALQGLGVAGDVATFAAPATLGASAVLGAMLKAPRAATKYKFENPIKVYQGRSKKGTKDFINPTDFYGDEKVSFATTELATADQFANKQTVNYPGRAKDGSEGPTKTTLIPGDVAELEFDIQNPLEVNRKDIGFKRDNEKAVIAEAKAKGHDGLKIVNDVSDKVDYVAFDSEQVRVVNPSLYPDRDYDYSPTSAELPSDVASIAKVEPPTETQPGIIAFHGSGADFDEFKLDKIGTGEGAQAFGYGLYFTDSEDIAKFYQTTLGKRSGFSYEGEIIPSRFNLESGSSQKDQIISSIADKMDNLDRPASFLIKSQIKSNEIELAKLKSREADELTNDIITSTENELEILKSLDADKFKRGKTYKVDIAAKPDELLDYDLSLKEQPGDIKKILKPLYEKYSVSEAADFGTLLSSAYRDVPQDTFMEELLEKGIKGIKYKAGQLSGIKDSEATNFVIFDDKLIKILEKYGIVGPVAVSATAAALREDDGST